MRIGAVQLLPVWTKPFAQRQIRRVAESGYLHNIATLSSGQFAGAIIPFLAAPVLGRIYRPEDYALLAAYAAIVGVATSATTLHYHHSILVEQTTRRAHQMAWVALIPVLAISVIMVPLAIGIFLFAPFGGELEAAQFWFLGLPLSTAIAGISVVALSVGNRGKNYRVMALMQLASATSSALMSIALGLTGFGAGGLMTAYITSQAITLGFSLMILKHNRLTRVRPSHVRLRRLAIRHRGYPLFTLPGAFIQSITAQLPIFLLTSLGSASVVGAYSRAYQLLILPISMFGSAVGRVYFQRAAEMYNNTGSCRDLFVKTAGLIAVPAIPFLVIMALFGDDIFVIYLGQSWEQAGRIAQILAPLMALQMFVSSLGSSILFFGNQKFSAIMHTAGLLLAAVGCLIGWSFGGTAMATILGWAVAQGIFCLVQIAAGWNLSMRTDRQSS